LRDADQSTESPVGVGAIPIPSWPICTPIGRTVRRPTSGSVWPPRRSAAFAQAL